MNRSKNHWGWGLGCLCAALLACSGTATTDDSPDPVNSGEVDVDVAEGVSLFPDITLRGAPDVVGKSGGDSGEESDVVDGSDAFEPMDVSEPVDGEGLAGSDALVAEDGASSQPDADEPIDVVTPETGIPVENFLTLCNTLPFLKKEMTIEVLYKANFDANCPFSTDDNLAPVPAFSSARIDITKELELPLDSFPCEVRIKVLEKNFYSIEDGLIFRLNDIILLSNSEFLVENTVETPGSLSGLPLRRHEWETVKGLEYVTAGGPSYCLSATTPECVTPAPASQASFDYESDEAVSQDLAYDMATTGKSELTATLIGDDDPGDCQHSGFNVTVEVTYLDLSTE